jgi:hypothetical protein
MLTCLVLALIGVLVPAPQETLRDLAKKLPSVTRTVFHEHGPADFPTLAAEAEIIVNGVVISETTRLSPDERQLFTDVTLSVFKSAKATDADNNVPVVVRRDAGVIQLEGKTVTVEENGFPAFEQGAEYILFLKKDQKQNVFRVIYGARGAFRCTPAGVRQLSRDATWNESHPNTSANDFWQELIQELARKREPI